MLGYGFGAAWSASSSGLVRLSIPDAKPTIVVKDPIDDVSLTSTSVYALSSSEKVLLRVDPRSLAVTRRWSLGPDPQSLASSDQAVYVGFTATPPRVERIDTRSGTIMTSVVPDASGLAKGRAIAYGAGTVWVTDGSGIYRLDPKRLSSRGFTSIGPVADLWFGNGSLWAASQDRGGGVYRVDPTNGCAVARSSSDAIQIAFSPNVVWLAAAAGTTAIDPSSAQTLATLPPSEVLTGNSSGIAVVGNEVWVSYPNLRKIQRINSRI